MSSSEALDTIRQALTLMFVLAAPVLVTGLVVGLIVSLLQAMTQVQELTLSFVPKIAAMLIALMLTGPWMLQRLIEFSRQMFSPW